MVAYTKYYVICTAGTWHTQHGTAARGEKGKRGSHWRSCHPKWPSSSVYLVAWAPSASPEIASVHTVHTNSSSVQRYLAAAHLGRYLGISTYLLSGRCCNDPWMPITMKRRLECQHVRVFVYVYVRLIRACSSARHNKQNTICQCAGINFWAR